MKGAPQNIILEVKDLKQYFRVGKGILDELTWKKGRLYRERQWVQAVNGVSFNIQKGTVYSLVGESGCGKSTTARTIIKLLDPKGGKILFQGVDITHYTAKEMLPLRKQIQMIFQDPYASLNPRSKVIDIVLDPILFHGIETNNQRAAELAIELLRKVGIRPEQASRYPHQFSGGQQQRIGIARALSVHPQFIIADEPVSALDVSIQAQILNLLMDLQREYGFSYLFIAHNLAVVKHLSDYLGIMYLGKIVENGKKEHIFSDPKHPYTAALLNSIPRLSGKNLDHVQPIQGEIPSPLHLPKGCYFHERCPFAKRVCREIFPEERPVGTEHTVCCHLY